MFGASSSANIHLLLYENDERMKAVVTKMIIDTYPKERGLYILQCE